jgi:hypothetical protein
MSKMKTIFELEVPCSDNKNGWATTFETIKIIGEAPKDRPYVSISAEHHDLFIPDKDLERFAVNILKALKSKHLKQ